MAVRLRYKLILGVSSSSAEEKDLGNATYEVMSDGCGEGGAWKTLVAAGATDVQLQMANVASAKFIAIRTNSKDPTVTPIAITIKRNTTGGEAISIAPLSGASEGHFLLSTASGITAIYATNAGSVDMEVTVFTAGD